MKPQEERLERLKIIIKKLDEYIDTLYKYNKDIAPKEELIAQLTKMEDRIPRESSPASIVKYMGICCCVVDKLLVVQKTLKEIEAIYVHGIDFHDDSFNELRCRHVIASYFPVLELALELVISLHDRNEDLTEDWTKHSFEVVESMQYITSSILNYSKQRK